MDRLLRGALAHVRRGNLRVTSAKGAVMLFGDGTGPPISVRFTSKAAQWRALLDPELRFGEAYMDGTFVVEEGSIVDFLALVAREEAAAPPWAEPLAVMRRLLAAALPAQLAHPFAEQRRPPLRSRPPALLAVPRFRPAVQLRLFRGTR